MLPNTKILGLIISISIILFAAIIVYAQEEPPAPPPDMGGEMGGDVPMPPPPEIEDAPMDMPPEDAVESDSQNQSQSGNSAQNNFQASIQSKPVIIRPETKKTIQNTELDYSRFTTQLGKGLDKTQLTLLSQATANLNLSNEEAMVILPKIIAIIKFQTFAIQELQSLRANLRVSINSGKIAEDSLKPLLAQFNKKTAELDQKLETLETDLRTVLTFKQEAQLTLNGVITNGIENNAHNYTAQAQTRKNNRETKAKS